MLTRRKLLSLLAAVPFIGVGGCKKPGPIGLPGTLPGVVDAHCHLFNATDLTVTRFIHVVLLKLYPQPGGPSQAEQWLEGTIRRIVELLAEDVPTATRELRELNAEGGADRSVPRMRDSDQAKLEALKERASQLHRQVEQQKARLGRGGEDPPDRCIPPEGAFPATTLGTAWRWVGLFRAYRRQLAAELARTYVEAGYRPRLLCPALVDYSNWLDDRPASKLPNQIRVMGAIAKLPDLPPVHGYAPFDPLRRALVRERLDEVDPGWDPLSGVEEALLQHGFAGIKLYPPMGFKPEGNAASAQHYPPAIIEKFGSAEKVGRALDRSLDELWTLAERLDAPIMAHAHASNAAGYRYGERGDPAHWVKVLHSHPALRVMLGHFGRFRTVSLGHGTPGEDCDPAPPFDASWEGTVARFLRDNPSARLFADISYLSEVFETADADYARGRMQSYLEADPGARHLVFGSDWVMLGIEKQYRGRPPYVRRVAAFLQSCGLDAEAVAGVMEGNALRFLGLGTGDRTRKRLLDFYGGDLPADRLPLAT
jgi:predicted TIM-barrel fold metal-dependent hydrolase